MDGSVWILVRFVSTLRGGGAATEESAQLVLSGFTVWASADILLLFVFFFCFEDNTPHRGLCQNTSCVSFNTSGFTLALLTPVSSTAGFLDDHSSEAELRTFLSTHLNGGLAGYKILVLSLLQEVTHTRFHAPPASCLFCFSL